MRLLHISPHHASLLFQGCWFCGVEQEAGEALNVTYAGFELTAAQQSFDVGVTFSRIIIPMIGSTPGDHSTLPQNWSKDSTKIDMSFTPGQQLTNFKTACAMEKVPAPY